MSIPTPTPKKLTHLFNKNKSKAPDVVQDDAGAKVLNRFKSVDGREYAFNRPRGNVAREREPMRMLALLVREIALGGDPVEVLRAFPHIEMKDALGQVLYPFERIQQPGEVVDAQRRATEGLEALGEIGFNVAEGDANEDDDSLQRSADDVE